MRRVADDRWDDASAYDRFMGRWSRRLARGFVTWLDLPPGAHWLEIGCGTGSLTRAVCELGAPASVVACDTAPDYVAYCSERLHYEPLAVVPVTGEGFPKRRGGFDAVVSSLVLNFLPSPVEALARMRDACAPGGRVAACVWDYGEGMRFLRLFWDAAVALDPEAAPLDEARRFPLCAPEPLRSAFETAGLEGVRTTPLEIATRFASFDDFWAPFLDGPGPAPTYVAALDAAARRRLEQRLAESLGTGGPIALRARAWAASGTRPHD